MTFFMTMLASSHFMSCVDSEVSMFVLYVTVILYFETFFGI